MFEADYTYGVALARRGFWQYLRHSLVLPLAGVLTVAAFGYALAFSSQIPMFSGVVVGMVMGYLLLIVRSYRQAVRTGRFYADSNVHVRIDEAGLSLSSPRLSSTCPWGSLSGMRTTREFLFLTLKDTSRTVVMPIGALPPAAIEFVRARVPERGGRRNAAGAATGASGGRP